MDLLGKPRSISNKIIDACHCVIHGFSFIDGLICVSSLLLIWHHCRQLQRHWAKTPANDFLHSAVRQEFCNSCTKKWSYKAESLKCLLKSNHTSNSQRMPNNVWFILIQHDLAPKQKHKLNTASVVCFLTWRRLPIGLGAEAVRIHHLWQQGSCRIVQRKW